MNGKNNNVKRQPTAFVVQGNPAHKLCAGLVKVAALTYVGEDFSPR
jgi:hypothetical protein